MAGLPMMFALDFSAGDIFPGFNDVAPPGLWGPRGDIGDIIYAPEPSDDEEEDAEEEDAEEDEDEEDEDEDEDEDDEAEGEEAEGEEAEEAEEDEEDEDEDDEAEEEVAEEEVAEEEVAEEEVAEEEEAFFPPEVLHRWEAFLPLFPAPAFPALSSSRKRARDEEEDTEVPCFKRPRLQ